LHEQGKRLLQRKGLKQIQVHCKNAPNKFHQRHLGAAEIYPKL
jgi:hypothetical protein